MRHYLIYSLFIIGIILLLSSCAQVVPLSGGEKDTTPPQLISSDPKNAQLNCSANKIGLVFNEYIKLNNASQILISPRLKEQPEININGKKLNINWKDNLEPNTTYRVYFGNAIADVTENNSITDFEFCFSTGEYIDSSSVSGNIIDAFTLKPISNALVGLYSSKKDSAPFTEKSVYTATSTIDGYFKIPLVKKGIYQLIAISDNNKNELYDIGEKIAFIEKPIKVDSFSSHQLSAFAEESSKLFVKKTIQVQPEKYLIQFNKKINGVNNINLYNTKHELQNDFKWTHQHQSDSLFLYIKSINQDTLFFGMEGLTDSVKLIVQGKEELKKQFVRSRFPLELKPILNDKNSFPYFSSLTLLSNFLLKEIDIKKIVVYVDGKEIKLAENEIKLLHDSIIISAKWEEQTTYQFNFLPGAIKDNHERTNDTLSFNFKTNSKDDYGVLLVIYNKINYGKIIQLINSKNTCVFEQKINSVDKIKINNLLPDNYFIRMIDDLNGDNKFSPGNFINRVQAEKIYQLKDPVKILAGWENEINLPDQF
jgi:hypothetical protein